MKMIELHGPNGFGKFVVIDDEDFEELSKYKWNVRRDKFQYPVAYYKRENNKQIYIIMHRFILKAKKGDIVDHINHNTLDNRKCNLRTCTMLENIRNRKKSSIAASVYKGVSFDKRSKKWNAYIGLNYRKLHLGTFLTDIEAAKAYDKKAKEIFGEFAYLNFQ